ncbi:MAG: WD40/YVTN/BNR-like repeat-containing protein [Bryobacteraceae bacterium]
MKGAWAKCGVWMALAALAATPALGAEKWRVSYFYDKENANLVINDLAFPSAARGVAAGYLNEKDVPKPVTLSTDDGGAHWTVSKLKQIPISMFFLNEKLGWMVTPEGVWHTLDAGREWRELPKSPKLLMQVYFLDEARGFAIGAHKLAFQTEDGGKTWDPIAAAAEPQTEAEYTVYNAITFANAKTGLIDGFSAPPRRSDGGWMDGEDPTKRREWPHLSIMLDTRDGGKTWTPTTASMFGHITRTCFLPDGRGLGLIEFTDTFKWPSEVHLLDGTTGKSAIVYNAPDRAITDVLVQPSGTGYLAGMEVLGKLQHTPIPRKLVVLKSDNLTDWREMDVDYRANASRAMLRAAPDGSVWVATDTGMILKLGE